MSYTDILWIFSYIHNFSPFSFYQHIAKLQQSKLGNIENFTVKKKIRFLSQIQSEQFLNTKSTKKGENKKWRSSYFEDCFRGLKFITQFK